MITFATLLLALVVGPHAIEVLVDESVHSVEFVLDGRALGRLEGPPWTQLVNFGFALLPHELEAVAYDNTGQEVGRARQWINLPRDPAEIELVVSELSWDQGPVAQLVWRNVVASQPKKVTLALDGKEIPVDDPERIQLPPLDREQLHLLTAEVEFPGNIASTAEVTFGGTYADEVTTELTAVPVELHSSLARLTLGSLQGRFVADGKTPLAVTAIEKGAAELLVVAPPTAGEQLTRVVRSTSKRKERPRSERDWTPLGDQQRLQVLWPFGVINPKDERRTTIFPRSESRGAQRGGLVWQLLTAALPKSLNGNYRMADAVAVAARAATQRDRRRLVLVILPDREDLSFYSPRGVRNYLEALGVPLEVWILGSQMEASPAAKASAELWGPSRWIASFDDLQAAMDKLRTRLDRQRVVWLEGDHLPQNIQLREGQPPSLARDLVLAGRPLASGTPTSRTPSPNPPTSRVLNSKVPSTSTSPTQPLRQEGQ